MQDDLQGIVPALGTHTAERRLPVTYALTSHLADSRSGPRRPSGTSTLGEAQRAVRALRCICETWRLR